jgi:hypothetical protein
MTTVVLRDLDWTPPKFLLRGLRLTSDGGPVQFVEPRFANASKTPEASVPSARNSPALEADRARIAAVKANIKALAQRLEDAKDGRGQSALALAVQLRRLRERHAIQSNPLPLPLGPAIEAKSIKIKGYAATSDVDADRARFAPSCSWPKLDPSKIRLLISHDEAREAGHIDSIEVDSLGRVVVVATITDPFAMRLSGLSISASVERFTIRHADSPTLMAGEIEAVRAVDEVSLTSTPANPKCLVFERAIPSAVETSYDELLAAVKRVRETAAALVAA